MTSQTPKYQLVVAESGDAADMPTYTSAAQASVEAALDRVLSQANTVAAGKVAKGGDTMTGPLNVGAKITAAEVQTTGDTVVGGNVHAAAGSGNFGFDLAIGRNLVFHGLPATTDSANKRWLLIDANGTTFGLTDVTFRLIVAAIGQTSTRRLKTKIATGTAPDVTRLQPRAYQWTDDAFKQSSPGTRYGLIAEEVAEVDPRLVTHDTDGQVAGLDQHALIAALVAKVTELQARLDALDPAPTPRKKGK